MQDQMFDRRLGMLFVSDAVRAIPDGTSVLADINRRVAHKSSPRRRSLVIVSSVTAVALGLLLAVTPARAAVGDFLRFAFVQRHQRVAALLHLADPSVRTCTRQPSDGRRTVDGSGYQ